MSIVDTATQYVLFTPAGRRLYFRAANDRAAKGEARRLIGRPHATYPLGDEYCDGRGLRAVVGYCMGARVEAGHAALYAVVTGTAIR